MLDNSEPIREVPIMRILCNGKTLAFQANDAGSIPAIRSNAPIAQLEEQLICNHQVVGSIPTWGTIYKHI